MLPTQAIPDRTEGRFNVRLTSPERQTVPTTIRAKRAGAFVFSVLKSHEIPKVLRFIASSENDRENEIGSRSPEFGSR